MPDLKKLFENQKEKFKSVKLSTLGERQEKLIKLREVILAKRKEIQEAVHADFRKAHDEVDLTEVLPTVAEINFAIKNLKSWMTPKRVSTPLTNFGTKSFIHYEPKGVSLIIAPWNYPFFLMISPLVAAVAAGNCAVLKPSEITPETSHLIKRIVADVFPTDEVAVVEGGPEEAKALLDLPFDHIFYTGSTRVGKIIMQAAAKNLTPVTLELGGKSPAIIEETADLDTTAERIVWGKFINAGQTCIAPDYVFVPEGKKDEFIRLSKKHIEKLYGSSPEDRKKSKDYCRIVNQNHWKRLSGLLEEAQKQGAKVECGGVVEESERFIDPTILTNVSPKSEVMKEEIFGPLLPVLTYRNINETWNFINDRDKPLALYVFSRDLDKVEDTIQHTSSGGACINNTIVHLTNPYLPFGGVGGSGMGSYHGVFGFKAFSHERAVMTQGFINATKSFYPPYTDSVRRMIQWALKYLA